VLNQPANQSYTMTGLTPMVRRNGKTTVVTGREQSATISGSTTFAVTRYRINPGMSANFPWLQLQAQGWEKYRFRRLTATYVPSAASANDGGQTQMAWDYDPSDSVPGSELAMSAYEGSSPKAIRYSNSISLDARTIGFRKVRCGAVSGDLILYDAASCIVATNACADSSVIGTLWYDYEVEFEHKQLEPSAPIPTQTSVINLSAANTCANGVQESIPFDEWIVNGLEVPDPTAGVFTLPCGQYKVEVETSNQDTVAEVFTVALSLYKNGAALAPDQTSATKWTTTAGGYFPCSLTGYVSVDGSDTVSIRVALNGAAGVLTNAVDRCRCVFTAL